MVPDASKVTVLAHGDMHRQRAPALDGFWSLVVSDLERLGRALGVTLQYVLVNSPEELRGAVEAVRRQGCSPYSGASSGGEPRLAIPGRDAAMGV